MNQVYYNTNLAELESKEYIEAAQQWADQERLAQQFQQPGQFRLVRLAVVLIAASLIAALLLVGI